MHQRLVFSLTFEIAGEKAACEKRKSQHQTVCKPARHANVIYSIHFQDETIVIRRYYSGVQRGDEIINVRDSVLLKSGTRKKDPHFVARVSGLWEENEGKYNTQLQ